MGNNHGSSRADNGESRRGSSSHHGSTRRVGRYSGRSRSKGARGNHVTMMGSSECEQVGSSPSRGYKHGPSRRRVHSSRRGGEYHEEAYVPDVDTSILRKLHVAYRKGTHEIGYNTDGHKCVTAEDVEIAKQHGSSLLYGEVLPSSVVKMLDCRHLDASTASVLFDLGSGTGKLAMQAFLMYPNLKEVVGVELCQSRFELAENAAVQLATRFPDEYTVVDWVQGRCISVATTKGSQHLTLRQGDLLETPNLDMADIVILQTDLPQQVHARLVQVLADHKLRTGVRVLSYLNLREVWASVGAVFPLEQHSVNKSPYDRFLTSWSYVHGHHFYVWHQPLPGTAAPTAAAHAHAPGDSDLVRSLPHTVPPEDPRDDPEASTGRSSAALGADASEPPSGTTPRHAASVPLVPPDAAGAVAAVAGDVAARGMFIGSFIPVAKPCLRNVDTDSDDVSPPETPFGGGSGEESRRASEDSSGASARSSRDAGARQVVECSEVHTPQCGTRVGSASGASRREWATRETNGGALSSVSPRHVPVARRVVAPGHGTCVLEPAVAQLETAEALPQHTRAHDRMHLGAALPSTVQSQAAVHSPSLRAHRLSADACGAHAPAQPSQGHAAAGSRSGGGTGVGDHHEPVAQPDARVARRPGLMRRLWRRVVQRLS